MFQDFKYAVRSLLRVPAFTLAVILTLALGIGANTSIFTIVNAVVLRPLPYAEPERLVRITSELRTFNAVDTGIAAQELVDYQAHTDIFSDVAGLYPVNANVTGADEPERVDLLLVSPNYFALLGAAPALGRVFGPQDNDPGIAAVAVLSDGFWRRRMGADPSVVGRTLMLDGDRTLVVGVMPPEFRHPGRTLQTDVQMWSPAGFRATPFATPNRTRRFLAGCLARLRPGVTLEQAQSRLDAYGLQVSRQFATDYPAANGWKPLVMSLRDDVVGSATTPMLILMTGVSLLLLIVCANVAHLVLARSAERDSEIALRQALGASAGRVVRQMLTESALLACAGGALGLLLAAWSLQGLIALAPSRLPRITEVSFDGASIGITVMLSGLTAVLLGLVPAWRLRRLALSGVVREGGLGRSVSTARTRFRSVLVSGQVAIATILLIGAGLLIRTVGELLSVPLGFETNGLLTARVWLPRPNDAVSGKYVHPENRATFARELLGRLAAVPGVAHAALSTQIPMGGYNAPLFFEQEGRDVAAGSARPTIHYFQVSPSYFTTLGLPIVRGRGFSADDRPGTEPVVIVSDTAARSFWKDTNPIGMRVRLAPDAPWMRVVGVAADVKSTRLSQPPQPIMYCSMEQAPPSFSLAVLIRSSEDTPGLAEAIAREVRAIDPDLPVYNVRSMNELIGSAVAERRFLMRLLASFGIAAVAIALVGIYGVMAYTVSRRTREIGIRMAIGARSGDVSRMIVRHGLVLTGAGLVVGMATALALSRQITSQLFGVQPTDPRTIASVLALMVIVALAAAYLPARRAARVDPLIVLRSQ